VEADFLIKMQDADGGFYFLVYPSTSSMRTAFPRTGGASRLAQEHSVSAASTAALAEAGSSPAMKQYYRRRPRHTWPRPKRDGFLQAATAKYGKSRYRSSRSIRTTGRTTRVCLGAPALYRRTGSLVPDAAIQPLS